MIPLLAAATALGIAGAIRAVTYQPPPPDPHHNKMVDAQEKNSFAKCHFGKDLGSKLAGSYQRTLSRFSNASLELFARENITVCIDLALDHNNYRGRHKAIVAIYYPQERVIGIDPMFAMPEFDKALSNTPSWANFKVYKRTGNQRAHSVDTEIVQLNDDAVTEFLKTAPVLKTAPARGLRNEGPLLPYPEQR